MEGELGRLMLAFVGLYDTMWVSGRSSTRFFLTA